MRYHHSFSSSYTFETSVIQKPVDVFSACCRWVNMPAATAMAGTALLSIPRILYKCLREQQCAIVHISAIEDVSSPLQPGGKSRICFDMYISHPRMVFCVLHVASAYWIFLIEMDS